MSVDRLRICPHYRESPAAMNAYAVRLLLVPLLLFSGLASPQARSQMPDPPGQAKPGESAKHEAYLFAHMLEGDYGRLYYSVSLDGLHWDMLNGGKRVLEDYHGHADICHGHDGRYYLVGNRGDDQPDINFWVSDDLLAWRKHSDYVPDLTRIPEYPRAMARIGAPKLYFDEPSAQYLVTWHTTHDLGQTDLPEPYWAGQRTIYATSPDLQKFSDPPRRLFVWDMATIDVIIRWEGSLLRDRQGRAISDARMDNRQDDSDLQRPVAAWPVHGARATGQSRFPRSADADSVAGRQSVVPLLRTVPGGRVRIIGRPQSAGTVVSGRRRYTTQELEQIQSAVPSASRLHDTYLSSAVRRAGAAIRQVAVTLPH